jgi:hypothetical protein
MTEVEKLNGRLEEAALTTARALQQMQSTGTPCMRSCVAKKSRRIQETSYLSGTRLRAERRALAPVPSSLVPLDAKRQVGTR